VRNASLDGFVEGLTGADVVDDGDDEHGGADEEADDLDRAGAWEFFWVFRLFRVGGDFDGSGLEDVANPAGILDAAGEDADVLLDKATAGSLVANEGASTGEEGAREGDWAVAGLIGSVVIKFGGAGDEFDADGFVRDNPCFVPDGSGVVGFEFATDDADFLGGEFGWEGSAGAGAEHDGVLRVDGVEVGAGVVMVVHHDFVLAAAGDGELVLILPYPVFADPDEVAFVATRNGR